MKVLDVIKGSQGNFGWRVLTDNVILKGRNPFFLPDFEGGVSCHPGIALKTGRLGKGIEPRFAGRYVSELAPALIFRAESYARQLRSMGLPDSSAYCFDKSVICGETFPFPGSPLSEVRVRFSPHDKELVIPDLHRRLEEGIAMISRDNTLRMGDIILLSADYEGLPVVIGDRLEMEQTLVDAEGKILLHALLKVRIL